MCEENKEKTMTKKSFVIILGLSLIVMYGASIVDAVVSGTLLGGKSGFPFKDSNTTMFGGGTTNYLLTTLNVIFWFVVIWAVWKVLQKIATKK